MWIFRVNTVSQIYQMYPKFHTNKKKWETFETQFDWVLASFVTKYYMCFISTSANTNPFWLYTKQQYDKVYTIKYTITEIKQN